jgi:hypothetical protein
MLHLLGSKLERWKARTWPKYENTDHAASVTLDLVEHADVAALKTVGDL